MQVKTAMKRKVGKEPAGGSKKRKEVGNELPLASMFQKQHPAIDLNKAREAYNVLLQKVLGLDEAEHAEPVRRSENNTHPIVESDTVDATAAVSHPVGNVPAVVNIKTLKGRFIAHSFSTGWAAGVVWSVAGQFAVKYKSETYCWAQKQY